jgi:hypothetical protein
VRYATLGAQVAERLDGNAQVAGELGQGEDGFAQVAGGVWVVMALRCAVSAERRRGGSRSGGTDSILDAKVANKWPMAMPDSYC